MANQSVFSSQWGVEDARELYGFPRWASDYFDIAESGEVTVSLPGAGGERHPVALARIMEKLRGRFIRPPVILRFGDLIDSRIQRLNESFRQAIQSEGYQGTYQGVYPVKVNQQRQVIDHVVAARERYGYGLEAGSKAELVAASAYMKPGEAYLVCNGYKDADYVGLALRIQKMGVKVVLVLEMPRELDLILKIADQMGVEPQLGVRVRLVARSDGYWQHSSGEESAFGLQVTQLMEAVDHLKAEGKLSCLRMLHFHQGSQIPNILAIRQSTQEAMRIYADLVKEGAPMGLIDVGGGLAVDSSAETAEGAGGSNYEIEEYCADIVHVIRRVADAAGVSHPTIISESGRAIVAHSSVLVFDVVDVNRGIPEGPFPEMDREVVSSVMLRDLLDVKEALEHRPWQECLNDLTFYRDQLRQMHLQGLIPLRERALAESICSQLMKRIVEASAEETETLSEEGKDLENFGLNVLYGNFSLFQSLSDAWGIGQIFPVLPLRRLDEAPQRRAVLADLTCDCDGQLSQFFGPHGVTDTLPVHAITRGERYEIGVFLVGAYQESLGDLHNLFGRTHIVNVALDEANELQLMAEDSGDTVSAVLAVVDHDQESLRRRFRELAEEAIETGRVTRDEGEAFMDAYSALMASYTYFKT